MNKRDLILNRIIKGLAIFLFLFLFALAYEGIRHSIIINEEIEMPVSAPPFRSDNEYSRSFMYNGFFVSMNEFGTKGAGNILYNISIRYYGDRIGEQNIYSKIEAVKFMDSVESYLSVNFSGVLENNRHY